LAVSPFMVLNMMPAIEGITFKTMNGESAKARARPHE
jgi:hypothetical protein